MSTPNTFVGIGAQKAGTTTLTAYLSAHPQVHVPTIKEMHFFDLLDDEEGIRRRLTDDIRRRHRRLEAANAGGHEIAGIMEEIQSITQRFAVGHDPERYRAMLRDAPTGTRICGEFTPAYAAMGAERIARIAQVLDRPRILFILRNPVDRFLSQVSHKGTPLARVQSDSDTPVAMLKRVGFTSRSRYDQTLQTLKETFPEEDVFVGFFEDMLGPDAVDFHQRLCAFLEIDAAQGAQTEAGKVIKPRPGDPEVRRALIAHFAPVYHAVKQQMGKLPENWEADMAQL